LTLFFALHKMCNTFAVNALELPVGGHESCPIPSITVRELLADEATEGLQLSLVGGAEGLDNTLNRANVQRPGLALAGFLEYIHPGLVQVFGKPEISFLLERSTAERSRILSQLCRQGGSCFLLASGLEAPAELIEEADRHGVALLRTDGPSAPTIDYLTRYLEDRLAPRTVVHGVLLEIYGLGVLLLGESGMGKSECALDLVVRGHRLVADDTVEIRRRRRALIGTGPELTRYHMELRGLGIVNVKELFGVGAVRMAKLVELVIRLDPWEDGKHYDRLGLDEQVHEILGIELPYVEMPVGPGRHLSVLVEVAARNQLLKQEGHHPARQLVRLLGQRITDWSDDQARRSRGNSLRREGDEGED
jgi:HPr kinase/phosphorylase